MSAVLKNVLVFMVVLALVFTVLNFESRHDFVGAMDESLGYFDDLSSRVQGFLPESADPFTGYNGVSVPPFDKFFFHRVYITDYDGAEYYVDFAFETKEYWRLFNKDWYYLYTNCPAGVKVKEYPLSGFVRVTLKTSIKFVTYGWDWYKVEPVEYMSYEEYLEKYH